MLRNPISIVSHLFGREDADWTRQGAGTFVLQASGYALSVAVTLALARALAPEAFGTYTFALSLFTVLIVPIYLGISNLLAREIVALRANGHEDRARGALQRAYQSLAGIGLPLSAAVALGASSLAIIAPNTPAEGPEPEIALYFSAAVVVLFRGLLLIHQGLLRGLTLVAQGQLGDQLFRPLIFLATIPLLIYLFAPTSTNAMMAHAAAAAAACLIATAAFPGRRSHSLMRAGRTPYDRRAWFHSLLPFVILAFAQNALFQVDLVMLGVLDDAPDDLARYRLAGQAAALAALPVTALNLIIASRAAHLSARRETDRLRSLALRAGSLSFLLTTMAGGLIILLGEPLILTVVGTEYVGFALPLAWLVAAKIVIAPAALLIPLLAHAHSARDAAVPSCIAIIFNLALCALLIPAFDLLGAALANFSTACLWSGLLFLRARTRLTPTIYS